MIIVVIIAAAVAVSGTLLSLVLLLRRRPVPPVRPICGCGHHRSFHDEGKGRCLYKTAFFMFSCSCRVYTGPEPLPEYYAPPIDGGRE
jgi:hypothetical protein